MYCLENMGQEYTIKELGGIGIITSSDTQNDIPMTTLIPGTTVSVKDGMEIDKYISSSKYVSSLDSRMHITVPSKVGLNMIGDINMLQRT